MGHVWRGTKGQETELQAEQILLAGRPESQTHMLSREAPVYVSGLLKGSENIEADPSDQMELSPPSQRTRAVRRCFGFESEIGQENHTPASLGQSTNSSGVRGSGV